MINTSSRRGSNTSTCRKTVSFDILTDDSNDNVSTKLVHQQKQHQQQQQQQPLFKSQTCPDRISGCTTSKLPTIQTGTNNNERHNQKEPIFEFCSVKNPKEKMFDICDDENVDNDHSKLIKNIELMKNELMKGKNKKNESCFITD